MTITDLGSIPGRRYPAGRLTQNIAGGASPISAVNFALGRVVLDPEGGQVPWHAHEQEELYFILSGEGEVCVGAERGTLRAGQAVYVPPAVHHQLTNTGAGPLTMIYCYGPAGEVSHWREELAGTLPEAGVDAPPLPDGARPQRR